MRTYNYTIDPPIFELKDVGTWEQLEETDSLRVILSGNSNRLAWLFYLLPKYSIADNIKNHKNTEVMNIDVEVLLKVKNLILSYELP